jgi:hypothetical protein
MSNAATGGAPAPADDLATLYPAPLELELAGKTVILKPLGMRRLGLISKPLRRIADATDEDATFADIIHDHAEDLIEAMSYATGEKAEWVGELLPTDFARLASAVYRLNADFFARQLPRLAEEVGVHLASVLNGVGRMSSPRSTEPESPTPAN